MPSLAGIKAKVEDLASSASVVLTGGERTELSDLISQLPPTCDVKELKTKGHGPFRRVEVLVSCKDPDVVGSQSGALAQKILSVPHLLKQSMEEEREAALLYRQRADIAKQDGDGDSAALWLDIAGEEDSHAARFSQRLKDVGMPAGDPPRTKGKVTVANLLDKYFPDDRHLTAQQRSATIEVMDRTLNQCDMNDLLAAGAVRDTLAVTLFHEAHSGLSAERGIGWLNETLDLFESSCQCNPS